MVSSQHRLDRAVQTVRHNGDVVSLLEAQINESGKARIDLDVCDKIVELSGGCAHEIDLPHEALARADEPRLPIVLNLAPLGRRKTLEQQIGCIERSDGSVEIDEHMARHTLTRHACGTR